MNTTQRHRISTYIGASCLAAALSFSTGATIATAAPQAPAMAEQDDSGSDQSGTDTGGSDTGGQTDGSHPQGTDTTQQDGSHPQGTDTTQQDGSHPQGTDTTQQDGSHPQGTDTTQQDGSHPQGTDTGSQPPGDTIKQPGNGAGEVNDQQACKNAGGIWADGYCGKFHKLEGTQQNPSPSEEQAVRVANSVVECTKFALHSVLGPGGKVIEVTSKASAIIVDWQGNKEKVVWEFIPGAKCTLAVVVAVLGHEIVQPVE
ncbi:hypothetical protein [Streptomyces sp. NBC_01233]|uniref:hypothetical protein n=1 Tax=Streptomyces sp. NBC_01233 TaxID=2903787 RepID=UPI002E0EBA9D|nr:hypothetical protein OG332_47300 [Streptomyces sp. NBC_01233]